MQNALNKYFHQQIQKSMEAQYAQKEKMKLKALMKSYTLKAMKVNKNNEVIMKGANGGSSIGDAHILT